MKYGIERVCTPRLNPGLKLWIPIRCGYVVYDFERTPAVSTIFSHLSRSGVESVGRYGGWKYSFMEETILDGKACAERLCASLV